MWKLEIGIDRGTLMSRDSQVVTSSFEDNVPLENLEDCVKCAKAWERNYLQSGYMIWYANAISPDKTVFNGIIKGHGYR